MFLLVVFFLLCANYWSAKGALNKKLPFKRRLISLAHFLTAQTFTTAFLVTLFTLGRLLDWLVAGVLVLGVGSVVLFGRHLVQYIKGTDASLLRWRTQLAVMAVAGGGYMGFAALDHWVFWGGKGAGVADIVALQVQDVTCDKLVLVNIKGDVARWRCPVEISIGNVQAGRVFSPWPSYISGESQELKEALISLERSL